MTSANHMSQTEHQRKRKGLATDAPKLFRVVFNPYHFANGDKLSESADFEPNARETRKLTAATEFEAEASFALKFNRQVLAVQEVAQP